MWRQDDEGIQRGSRSTQHHIPSSHEQHNANVGYYVGGEIEQHAIGRAVTGVDQYQDIICYPFSYVMISNDAGQDQQQYYHHYDNTTVHYPQQTMTNRSLARPQTPQSYFTHHHQPNTAVMMHHHQTPHQCHQQSQPPPPPSPSTAVPRPPTMATIGCNTTQQHCYNYWECNNTKITNDSASTSCTRRVPMEQPIPAGMTSTVIVNNNNLRQQSSNDDRTIVEKIPKTTKQRDEIEKQNSTVVDDNKVVTVCKRTITAAINKIIVDDYKSALKKLQKTIRILDILMFNENGSGIGSAKVETVKPWMETLKDMECQVSSKLHNNRSNNDDSENRSNVIAKTEFTYCEHLRQTSSFTNGNASNIDSSTNFCNRIGDITSNRNNEDGGAGERYYQRQFNAKRYRTTGKIIVKQRQYDSDRRRRYR